MELVKKPVDIALPPAKYDCMAICGKYNNKDSYFSKPPNGPESLNDNFLPDLTTNQS